MLLQLLTSPVVHRWTADTQEGIYDMVQLYVDLVAYRLQHEPIPSDLLHTLAMVSCLSLHLFLHIFMRLCIFLPVSLSVCVSPSISLCLSRTCYFDVVAYRLQHEPIPSDLLHTLAMVSCHCLC